MKRVKQAGFTLIEIMIVVAIIALLAAIAIPNVLRGRTTANESAAIGNMRAVVSSLEMYRSVIGSYPATDGTAFRNTMYGTDCLAATAPAPDFGPPSFCRVLDASEPGSVVQGYHWLYAAPAGGATYTLVGRPATPGTTGTRSFYADQTGLVRHCQTSTDSATAANMADDNTIDQAPTDPCT